MRNPLPRSRVPATVGDPQRAPSVRAYIVAPPMTEGVLNEMPIAADYPFLDVLWTMIIFFCWVAWIWILITVFVDVFRRDDIGGWGKAGWVVFTIVLPFLGVLIYLIAQHDGMRRRSMRQAEAQKQAFDQYVREAAGGSAAEIAKAKELLDAGTITQEEFDAIKAKALA
jgi:Short C-terminal domain/Phospholipase_D-nuclease N-terminal